MQHRDKTTHAIRIHARRGDSHERKTLLLHFTPIQHNEGLVAFRRKTFRLSLQVAASPDVQQEQTSVYAMAELSTKASRPVLGDKSSSGIGDCPLFRPQFSKQARLPMIGLHQEMLGFGRFCLFILVVWGYTISCGCGGVAQSGSKNAHMGAPSPEMQTGTYGGGNQDGTSLNILSPSPLLSGQAGSPYRSTLSAAGGMTPSPWSGDTGLLPSSVAWAPIGGSASGTPNTGGNFNLTLDVQGSAQQVANKTLPLANSSTSFDQHGGLNSVRCTSATGRFHMEKIGAHWWFCTPEGHGFFSQGLQLIGPDNNPDYFGRNSYSLVTSKYGSRNNWASMTAQRVQSWGFNTIDVGASVYMMPWLTEGGWPLDSNGLHTIPTKLPFISEINPGRDSVRNVSFGTDNWTGNKVLLTEAVKNVVSGWSALYTGWRYSIIPDYYDSRVYVFLDAELNPKTHLNQLSEMWTSPYLNYLIGLSIEDSDQMAGFTTDPSFKTNASPEWGWTLSTMAPLMTASYGSSWNYHADTTVYGKKALHDWLVAKYINISNMNKHWGSNYTSFDSTGTQITGEAVGSGDGSISTFHHTAAHRTPSRFSMQVLVNGTAIAGEHNNSVNYWENVTDVSAGMLIGPQVSGSVKFDTGAVTLTFAPVNVPLNRCQTDGSTVTVETHTQHGFWTGAKVTITGTNNCDIRNQTISVVDPWHFTFAKTRRFATEYPGKSSAIAAIPQSGDAITVSYVQNGYRIGTGFMDEDGRHPWIGKDYAYMTDVAPNVAADFRAFLVSMATYYFGTTARTLHARYPNLLYFDEVGAWNIPARAGTLQGSAPYVDGIMSGDQTVFTRGMMSFQYQYWGDKPLLEGIYLTANPDSDMFPFQANSTLATQEAKGQQYYNIATQIRNLAYPNGSCPYVGFGVWAYRDMMNERLNWGLVSYGDNAYDGHEDVTGKVQCSPPLQAYTCGGEPAYGTWRARQAVTVPSANPGNRIQVNIGGAYHIFEVTQAGTTGGIEPLWPRAVGDAVADGSVVWKNVDTKSNPDGFGDMITKVKQANALWYSHTP
jgi:hypothetical protein